MVSTISKEILNQLSMGKQKMFMEACDYRYAEVVKVLLNDHSVDPSINNNQAIRYAARRGYSEIVQLLLDHPRVNPTADRDFAIRLAYKFKHTEVVKLLKKYYEEHGLTIPKCVLI